MATYLVSHEWRRERTKDVEAVIYQLMGRRNQLPEGYMLLEVLLSSDKPRPLCLWKTKSVEGLEKLLHSVNPQTEHSIGEYRALYGANRVA